MLNRYFPVEIDFPEHVPSWYGSQLITAPLSALTALRFTQLLHPHEVTTSLLSILAQNHLSLLKSLPRGSLFALDDPITGHFLAVGVIAGIYDGHSCTI